MSDGTTPAPGVSLTVRNAIDDGALAYATANAAGQYSFANLKATPAGFSVVAQTHPFEARATGAFAANGETRTVDLVLPAVQGTIEGHVYGGDGMTPLPNAPVSLYDGTSQRNSTTTNASGFYRFANVFVRASGFTVRACAASQLCDAAEYSLAQTGQIATPGATATLNFTMPGRVGTIQGHLYIGDGVTPVAGGQVSAMITTAQGEAREIVWVAAGADGAFTFANLLASETGVLLRAYSPNSRTDTIIERTVVVPSQSATVSGVDLILPINKVAGHVRFADGTPVLQPDVHAIDVLGNWMYAATVQDQGSYTFYEVAPGPITVRRERSRLPRLCDPARRRAGAAGPGRRFRAARHQPRPPDRPRPRRRADAVRVRGARQPQPRTVPPAVDGRCWRRPDRRSAGRTRLFPGAVRRPEHRLDPLRDHVRRGHGDRHTTRSDARLEAGSDRDAHRRRPRRPAGDLRDGQCAELRVARADRMFSYFDWPSSPDGVYQVTGITPGPIQVAACDDSDNCALANAVVSDGENKALTLTLGGAVYLEHPLTGWDGFRYLVEDSGEMWEGGAPGGYGNVYDHCVPDDREWLEPRLGRRGPHRTGRPAGGRRAAPRAGHSRHPQGLRAGGGRLCEVPRRPGEPDERHPEGRRGDPGESRLLEHSVDEHARPDRWHLPRDGRRRRRLLRDRSARLQRCRRGGDANGRQRGVLWTRRTSRSTGP